jgi:hypothetical protein
MTTFTSPKFSDTPIISAAAAAPMVSEVQVNSVRDDEARADAARVGGWHEEFVVDGYAADAGNAGPGGDKIRPVQDAFAIDIGTSENLTLTGSAEDTSAGGAIVTDNKDPELLAAEAVAGDTKLAADRHGIVESGHAWSDFSPLIETDAAREAATEELFGNYNFVRIDPTASELVGGGSGNGVTILDGISDNASNALGTRGGGEVVAGDFYVTNGTTGTVSDSGNDAKITDITDGTSNTALDASGKDAAYIFGRTDGSAASNVIASLAEKYTMFEGEADSLLVGGAGVEHESATRPHSDGVVLLHGDFSSLVDTDAAIAATTDEIHGNYNFLRIEPTGSEVDSGVKSRFADEGLIGDTGDSLVATTLLHGDFSSLVDTDGKAGTDTVIEVDPIVLEPGQHKEELVGRLKYESEVTDDISLEPTRFENVTRPHSDGGVLLHGDVSSLVDTDAAVAAATEELYGNYNFVHSEPTASELLVGGAGGAGSFLVSRGGGEVFSSYVTNGTTGTVSDSGKDARIADITDGTSNTVMFGRTDDDGMSNVVVDLSVNYTMFDGDGDDLLPGGNGADRLVRVADLGVHSVLHGGDVFDVGDVLIGFDDAVDNGNDSQQTRTAGGSTPLQADPDGQANGIIAVLIGLYADIPGPLNDANPALD